MVLLSLLMMLFTFPSQHLVGTCSRMLFSVSFPLHLCPSSPARIHKRNPFPSYSCFTLRTLKGELISFCEDPLSSPRMEPGSLVGSDELGWVREET